MLHFSKTSLFPLGYRFLSLHSLSAAHTNTMKQRGGLSKTSDHRHRDSPSVKKKVMRRSRSRPHILSTHPSHQREKFGVEDFVASQFEVKFRQAEALSRLKGRTNVRVWAFESVNFKEGEWVGFWRIGAASIVKIS